MLIDETDTDFVTDADVGTLVDRRRSGRPAFDNPHLLRLLREPGVSHAIDLDDDDWLEDQTADEARPWFGYVVLASLAFWSLILRLML